MLDIHHAFSGNTIRRNLKRTEEETHAMLKKILLLTSALLVLPALPALSYVGPGAGVSLIGAFVGVFSAVVVALAVLLAYPFKKAMKLKKARAEANRREFEADALQNLTRTGESQHRSQGES